MDLSSLGRDFQNENVQVFILLFHLYPGWFSSVVTVLFTEESFHTSLILMVNTTTATEDDHSAPPKFSCSEAAFYLTSQKHPSKEDS